MLKFVVPDVFGQRELATVVVNANDVADRALLGQTGDGLPVYKIVYTDGTATQAIDKWRVLG